jgi:hypothetical protein
MDDAIAMQERDIIAARAGGDERYVALLERELELLRERRSLVAQGAARSVAAEEAKAAASEWKRSADLIERSLADALMRGFENGKSFAENFKSALINMFKTLVLEPIIRPIAQAGASALLGAFGMGGTASGAGGSLLGSFGSLGSFGGGGGGGGGLSGMIGSFTGGFDSLFQSAGVSMGSQFVADIGNYGMGMPVVGGLLRMAQGDFAGGAGSMVGGAIGSMFGPVGTAVGSFIGGSLFGGGDDAPGPGFRAPNTAQLLMGDAGYYVKFSEMQDPRVRRELMQSLNVALNDPAQFDPAVLDTLLGQRVKLPPGSGSQKTADQFLQLLGPASQAATASNQARFAQLAGGGALAQGLQGYVNNMSISEYLSPEARLAGARDLFASATERAAAGDIDAARSLPGFASTLLGAGRQVYASGPQFQALFAETNNEMIRVLKESGLAQEKLLEDMPASIRESGQATVTAIKKMNDDLIAGLEKLNQGLRQLEAMQGSG